MAMGLYDRDIVAWADQQADMLERLARGERVNDAVDWPHVIDEVRDVGQAQFKQCEGFLIQAITHLLKLHFWPDSSAVPHWTAEADLFLSEAARHYTPSMRQKLDLDRAFRTALRRSQREGVVPRASGISTREHCPLPLDELVLREQPDIDALLGRLTAWACDA